MKYTYIILLATMGLFITSCGSDDKNSDLIIGTWNISSIAYTDCTDSSDNFVETYGTSTCQNCERSSMTFLDSGSISLLSESISDGVVDYSDTTVGTYSFANDDETSMILCIDGDCFTGTLTVSESSMSWVASIEGCTATLSATM